MRKIKLTWRGPYSYRELLTNEDLKNRFHESDPIGVYLWVRPKDKDSHASPIINYVGRALGKPTLWKRHLEHYKGQIGGSYTIPHPFYESPAQDQTDWTVKGERVISDFFDFDSFSAITKAGFTYAQKIAIYICPLATKDDTGLAERNLLYELQPTDTKWGTLSVPPMRVEIDHDLSLVADKGKLQRLLHGKTISKTP